MKNYRTIHGVDIDVENDKVVLSHTRNGGFEEQTFKYLEKLIEKLSNQYDRPLTFADIGAYTGLYSIFAAKRGCVVEAFEPNPDVYSRLIENVDHNCSEESYRRIRFHKCAISDTPREAYFYTNPATFLTSGGSLNSDFQSIINTHTQKVPVQRYELEYFFLPDIVKIDVEGHEMSVLRGMSWLAVERPYLIVEANDQQHFDEIINYLENEIGGYGPWYKMDDRNIIIEPETL